MSKALNEDLTIKLMLGYLCIANESEASLVRKVQILDLFDLQDSEIAQICGTTVQVVRNSRGARKKVNKKKSNAKK
jgi:hypothetical protein